MIFFGSDDDKEEKSQESGSEVMNTKFLKTRQILLSGEVNKALAEKIVRQLLVMEADSDQPIRIFIDSPGGDVDAGYAIFDMIRFVKAPVYCIGMGLVASAGALILLAADKSRRVAMPNSRYLIHQPLSGIRGVATDIEIHAQELEKIKAKINQVISQETGKPLDQVAKDTDRDYWLSATEALDYGLVSTVVSRRDELEKL
ncbi:MAG: ATP-dependent Clp protease proteolytic subunit [Spirochaetaceae bacterium]|nr:ATP-dependent Clp protease proteolytic subunit [Spirochaetaceae bacterium]MBQ4330846.1 ATP-dependent Clp protease proteolytic subunit [Spirochaetaceae bacterium]MBR2362306.1 ATP-dependent Clp protease proteolytic subunit [Spirochaetaceae bacterium]MBR2463718.1 ATP-dependent Clp protease proteolytic subunit [Spirochaetaceae bacterium]